MSIFGVLFGDPTVIHVDREDDFSWNTSGTATRYLLVTCPAGEMICQGFGCNRTARRELLAALEDLSAEIPAKLLAIVALDGSSQVYDLDLEIARRRLRQ